MGEWLPPRGACEGEMGQQRLKWKRREEGAHGWAHGERERQ